MGFYRSFIAAVVLVFSQSCAKDKPIPPFEPSPITPIEHGMPIGITIPTAQLVRWIYEGDNCPNGWVMLYDALSSGEGNQRIVPLQEEYVKRFDDLGDLHLELVNAMIEIGDRIPIVSIGLSYVCWMGDETGEWRREMVAMIGELQSIGITVYINLNHNDSFPAELWDFDDIGTSGWANGRFIENWRDYVADVIRVFQGDNEFGVVLPSDTRVSLGQESVVGLFNGYLHHEAKYPPGGMRAGIAFTRAFANLQRASIESARLIADETDWMPTVGHNVRPIMDAMLSAGAEKLDLAHNWALLDAIINGCIDDDLDGECDEEFDPPIRFEIGVTFYGVMSSSESAVTVGKTLADGSEMTIPSIDVSPNADAFRLALDMVSERYPDTPLAIAEIGFSDAEETQQLAWLMEYLGELRAPDEPDDGRIPVSRVDLHTLFEAAEFGQGQWRFHEADDCSSLPCVFTTYGVLLLRLLPQWR